MHETRRHLGHTVDDAKLRFIKSVRAATRAQIRREKAGSGATPGAARAYAELFELVQEDEEYAIRLAAAHVIGSGGMDAFDAIQHHLVYSGRSWTLRGRGMLREVGASRMGSCLTAVAGLER